jgi:hypothetical protein
MLDLLNRIRWKHTNWFIQSVISQYFNASCVRQRAVERPIYVFTCKNCTLLTFPLSANDVAVNFQIDTITRFMRKHMKVKSATSVKYAHMHPSLHVILNRICSYTQMKSPSNARTVNRHSDNGNCWNGMKIFITIPITLQQHPKKKHTRVLRAKNRSGIKVI